jgi:hypothetical protein
MNAIKRNAAGKLPRMVVEFLLATTLEMSGSLLVKAESLSLLLKTTLEMS